MASIDERVVSMKFDNKGFATKSAETLSILDKLRDKLNFRGAAKGFADVEAASRNVKLQGIADAISSIESKFSVMGVVAFNVINRIVDVAINAGKQLANALGFGAIMEGFQEYQLNMNSIQTIMSNTKQHGTTLDDINKSLGELNEYSDLTIYNFAQMVQNIGMFTAAGVKLEDSVAAIKGFSNVSATAGANATDSAMAMYQLSQAMAAGEVRLMDWMSIERRGIGTRVFKEAIFETAKAMGTIPNMGQTFDEWEDSAGSFRETLQDGWLTLDVMTNTLAVFTGDLKDKQLEAIGYTEEQIVQMKELGEMALKAATEVKTISQLADTVKEAVGTGWSDSFRIVVGDFEEAKSLLTFINDVIGGIVGRAASARNEILQTWKDSGGRDDFLRRAAQLWVGIGEVINTIRDAFRDIFPRKNGKELHQLTNGFMDFLLTLLPTAEELKNIKSIFTGVFSVLAIGWEIVKQAASTFWEFATALRASTGASDALNWFANLGEKLHDLKVTLVDEGGIAKWFDDLTAKLKQFRKELDIDAKLARVREEFNKLKDAVSEFFDRFKSDDGVDAAIGGWSIFTSIVEGLGTAFEWLLDKAGQAVDLISEGFGKIADYLSGVDRDALHDVMNVGILASIAVGAKKFWDFLKKFTPQKLADDLEEAMQSINSALDGVTATLEAMQLKLKSEALLNIAIAVGVLSAALFVLSTIDPVRLSAALTATAVGFGELAGTMVVLTKITAGPGGMIQLQAMASGMILAASAVLILSGAVAAMGNMDPDALTRGILGVGLALAAMTATIGALSLIDEGKVVKAAFAMNGFATAMILVSGAIFAMGMMNPEVLKQGLIGVGVALAGMTAAIGALSMVDQGKLISAAIAMNGMAIALGLLSVGIFAMGMMDSEVLMQGMIAVASMLAAMVAGLGALSLIDNAKFISMGIGMMALAAALNLMVVPVIALGMLDTEQLITGLAGIAGVLAITALAVAAMSSGGMGKGVLGLIAVSGALVVMSGALFALSLIPQDKLIKAVLGMAAAIGIFVLAAYLITPLMLLNIAGLAAALLSFGASTALLGAGVMFVGAGIWLLVAAIRALVDLVVDSSDGVIQTIDLIINKFMDFLTHLFETGLEMAKMFIAELPSILEGLGDVFQTLLQEAREALPMFFALMGETISELLELLREFIPEFIDLGLEILLSLLHGINENIEEVTNTVVDILTKFMDTMTERMPELVESGTDLLVAFLQGITDHAEMIVTAVVELIAQLIQSLADNLHKLTEAGEDLIVALIAGASGMVGAVIQAGTDFVVSFLEGLGDAVTEIAAAGLALIQDILDAMAENFLLGVDAGKDFILEILSGMAAKTIEFLNKAADVLIALLEGIETAITTKGPQIRDAAMSIVWAILDVVTFGLKDNFPDPTDWIPDKLTLGGVSIDLPFGKGSGEGEGGGNILPEIDDSSIGGASSLVDQFNEIVRNIDFDEDSEFNPTITPVLDLSRVESDARNIPGLVGSGGAISVAQAGIISEVENERSIAAAQTSTITPTEVKFEQNIHAPDALSVGDIYRQTKSQIALAKEELKL